MKNALITKLALLLLLQPALPLKAITPQEQLKKIVSLKGTVTTQHNEPVDSARVEVINPAKQDTIKTTTNEKGEYKLLIPIRTETGVKQPQTPTNYDITIKNKNQLQVTTPTLSDLEIKLYNILGQQVFNHTQQLNPGTNTVKLPTTQLPNGTYIYQANIYPQGEQPKTVTGRTVIVNNEVVAHTPTYPATTTQQKKLKKRLETPENNEVTLEMLVEDPKKNPRFNPRQEKIIIPLYNGNTIINYPHNIVIPRFPTVTFHTIEPLTEQTLPEIKISIKRTFTDRKRITTDQQGKTTIYLPPGQYEIQVPVQKNVWGLDWPIKIGETIPNLELTIALIDTAAPIDLYTKTEISSWKNGLRGAYNWSWPSTTRTYVIVNPPDSEFVELTTTWLQEKISELDLKGRLKAELVEIITDTTVSPYTDQDASMKYGRGKCADILVYWIDVPKIGMNYTEKDSTGRVLWGEVTIRYPSANIGNPDRKTIVLGEVFQAFLPSPSDAMKEEFPQYQDTFFADDLFEVDPPTDWGNGPHGIINYMGLEIPVEVLKATLKQDLFELYGLKVRWTRTGLILPNTEIDLHTYENPPPITENQTITFQPEIITDYKPKNPLTLLKNRVILLPETTDYHPTTNLLPNTKN